MSSPQVSEPLKHGEGSQAFISYLITFESKVRRRFQDFILLHQQLSNQYPQCIIPPLPSKHRIEYISGDRFSQEFINKRIVGLQGFLDGIWRHQLLKKSECFKVFLEADQMALLPKSSTPTPLDHLGDMVLNAFSRVKTPDVKFTEIKQEFSKLEQNLVAIEKCHSKSLKLQQDLGYQLLNLGGSFESLGRMESQMTPQLQEFGSKMQEYSNFLSTKNTREELEYLLKLDELISYCQAAKDTLSQRDQKQVDHEELTRFLDQVTMERDKITSGRSVGIGGFITDKINDFKGVDPERTRTERISKLDLKITQLNEACESSALTSKEFSNQVLEDVEFLNSCKVVDMKSLLNTFSDVQLEFHEKVIYSNKAYEFFDQLIPTIMDMELK